MHSLTRSSAASTAELLILVPMLTACVAAGSYTDCAPATLQINKNSFGVGEEIRIQGTGYFESCEGEDSTDIAVVLYADGETHLLGKVDATDGEFLLEVGLPAGVEDDAAHLIADGGESPKFSIG